MLCCCDGDEGRGGDGDSAVVSGSGGDAYAIKQHSHNYFNQ